MTEKSPFYQEYQDAALAEGWGIFEPDGIYPEIQFTQDFPSPFNFDSEAVWHVMKMAKQGSDLHRRALLHIAEFYINAARTA